MNHLKFFIIAAALIAGASHAPASIIISELNSNGTGGDFFEIYNAGTSAVELGGWKWVDNASSTNGGPSFNGAKAFAFNAFTLNAGSSALVVSDAGGGVDGNTAFAASWGIANSNLLTFIVPELITGSGFGKSDLVALFDSTGSFVTGLNYGTSAATITQGDSSTVSLLPFLRAAGGTSAGGHAGIAGGGVATDSLVWNYWGSTADNPTYFSTSSVGFAGAFANAADPTSTTIGSPGVVPEPSSSALLGLGTMALLALRRLNRKA